MMQVNPSFLGPPDFSLVIAAALREIARALHWISTALFVNAIANFLRK